MIMYGSQQNAANAPGGNKFDTQGVVCDKTDSYVLLIIITFVCTRTSVSDRNPYSGAHLIDCPNGLCIFEAHRKHTRRVAILIDQRRVCPGAKQ